MYMATGCGGGERGIVDSASEVLAQEAMDELEDVIQQLKTILKSIGNAK